MASAQNFSSSWTGLLLAGGASKRMGQSKSQLRISDSASRTFLQQGWSQLQSSTDAHFLLGQSSELPQELQWPDLNPFAGPLKALVDALPKVETPWVLLLPVDMPGLELCALQEFQQFAVAGHRSAFTCPDHGQAGFPIALARKDFGTISQASQQGATSLFSVLKSLDCTIWTGVKHASTVLENINTPQQFREWQAAQESSCKPVH